MIIFHPWVPGHRPADQQRCWEALAQLRGRYQVIDAEIGLGVFDYQEALKQVWCATSLEGLLIVEHDVAPSLELVKELEVCPLDLCSRPPGGAPAGAPLTTWLGCTRFSWRAQQRAPWALQHETGVHWANLDADLTRTCARAAGSFWHIHPEPLEHYHNNL